MDWSSSRISARQLWAQHAARGGSVIAFDIAPTALRWCRRRFPDTRARYIEADLLAAPGEWTGSFDFVFEAYTLQVLPPELRPAALGSLARFLAAAGTLLLVCRGRDAADPPGDMPWPLSREELETREIGLPLVSFEDYYDAETPPVLRFRAVYRRV